MEDIPYKDFEIPVFGKYILDATKKIYGTIFGVSVFRGRNIQTGEPVAIKLVNLDSDEFEILRHEFEVLAHLKEIERIPTCLYFGIQGNYSLLIMNLLGPSLKDLINYCKGSFSLPQQ